ncbi:MAG: hypothetical protein LQ351_007060 [Letrouitia transgressa]|nr:MAG: hypothetical protein LQ351_007060 [Letrouitia transgressa]
MGHHLFYNSLDGQPISANSFHQSLSKAIGTTLAYFVRTALVIAIDSSYWQIFWDTLHHKTLTVSTIDSLAGVLGAFHELLNPAILKASPLLVALAVLSWLIPFVAIVPPVTLSISPSIFTDTSNMTLQAPDFSNRAAFAIINEKHSGPSNSFIYAGPNRDLMRLLMVSAYNEEFPVLPPPAQNSSYSQSWFAPAVKCLPIPHDILSDFKPATGGVDPSQPADEGKSGYHYLAWVPQSMKNATVPFGNDSIPKVGPLSTNEALGHINGQPAQIYVDARADISTSDWTVLNCSLHNASYAVEFAFKEKRQDVTVSSEVLSSVGPIDYKGGVNPYPGDWTVFATPELVSYEALMDVLGELLAGATWLQRESSGGNDSMDDSGMNTTRELLKFDRTRVLETLIGQTRELRPLYVNGTGDSLNATMPPTNVPSLSVAIESLFQNMTLALLSQPRYLTTQVEPVAVTSQMSRNVYVYNAKRLWFAYGLGLGLTLLVVGVGCWNVISADVSYSNRFSTMLRTTRGQELDDLVVTEYRKGEDPVPRAIQWAQMGIGNSLKETVVRNTSREGASPSFWERMSGVVERTRSVSLAASVI